MDNFDNFPAVPEHLILRSQATPETAFSYQIIETTEPLTPLMLTARQVVAVNFNFRTPVVVHQHGLDKWPFDCILLILSKMGAVVGRITHDLEEHEWGPSAYDLVEWLGHSVPWLQDHGPHGRVPSAVMFCTPKALNVNGMAHFFYGYINTWAFDTPVNTMGLFEYEIGPDPYSNVRVTFSSLDPWPIVESTRANGRWDEVYYPKPDIQVQFPKGVDYDSRHVRFSEPE